MPILVSKIKKILRKPIRGVTKESNVQKDLRPKAKKYSIKENSYGHLKRFKFILNAVESFAKDKGNVKILDVGCGTGGSITMPLGEEGYIIQGIDIDAEPIDYANTCNLYNNISFECKSANEVTDIYDVIIASEIIEHIDNPVDFLMSLKNRLSKDGIIIITTPNGYG